jgi:hypothetical protein
VAARRNSNSVCILNPSEAEHFVQTGILPSCSTHPHIAKSTATEYIHTLLYFDGRVRMMEASWAGKGKCAMLFHEARSWKVTCGDSGIWGWQLAHGGGIR